ncbi:TRAP transporter large permease subunit [Aureimonas mangrovi]|uniref:TRAP transporter large permease n=1 Tax=Aureimonas mangrovi TaxID=2758041 RepID=UPI00163D748D|nr:TRAP transporter large permease subunit [Aureimonas mangrovi]
MSEAVAKRQGAARHWADALEAAFSVAAGVVLALLLAVVAAATGARYLGGASLYGADELALWLHVALVFGALPLVSAGALAMRLDLLPSVVGESGRRLLAIVSEGIVVQACLVLLFGAVGVMGAIGGVSPVLGVPESWRFAPVVLGASGALVLMLLRSAGEGRLVDGLAALAIGIALHAFASFGVAGMLAHPSVAAGGFAFAALLAGAPLPHAVVAGASLAIPFGAMLPESAIVQNAVSGIGRFLLLAIPFFLLAGSLMTAGGLAERLVALARSFVGHWRGGMAQTVLGTNLLFSGLSGSSIADAAFGAKVLAPGLVKSGYAPERAGAIVAATAILPNIVPPSIAFLILAVATNLSVGALFAGGLAAGLFLAIVLGVTLHLVSRGVPGLDRAGPGARRAAFMRALPVLGLAIVIVLGIRFGFVTTTEAAALAALYALVVAFALKHGGVRDITATFAQAGREAASVGLLIGAAAPLTFLLAVDDLPGLVASALSGIGGPLTVLLGANLMLLAAGMVLDIGAAILLMAPLLMPVAVAAGIDPVAFGVILVVNLMIGGLTPPVGILVYVSARLSGVSPARVFVSALPLIAALIIALAALSLAVAIAAS